MYRLPANAEPEEKESEVDGGTNEEWSSPDEEEALAAVVTDTPENLGFGPARRENEAEGTPELAIKHIDVIIAIFWRNSSPLQFFLSSKEAVSRPGFATLSGPVFPSSVLNAVPVFHG